MAAETTIKTKSEMPAAPAPASEQAWENIHARRQAAATAAQAQEAAVLQTAARELAAVPRGMVTDLTPIWREVGPWLAKLPGFAWLARPLDRTFTAETIAAGDQSIRLVGEVQRLAGPDVLKRLEGLEAELMAAAALSPDRLAAIERELSAVKVPPALETLKDWRKRRAEGEAEWGRVADVALGMVAALALPASTNGSTPKRAA